MNNIIIKLILILIFVISNQDDLIAKDSDTTSNHYKFIQKLSKLKPGEDYADHLVLVIFDTSKVHLKDILPRTVFNKKLGVYKTLDTTKLRFLEKYNIPNKVLDYSWIPDYNYLVLITEPGQSVIQLIEILIDNPFVKIAEPDYYGELD